MNRATAFVKQLRETLIKKGHRPTTLCELIQRVRDYKQSLRESRETFDQITEFPEMLGNLQHHRIPNFDFNNRRYLLLHERADWSGVSPIMCEFTHRLMWRMRRNGFPTYVHTAIRTKEMQEQLYLEGHSRIRTNGPHQRGAAVDIVHADFNWKAHDDFWRYIGNVGKDIARQYDLPVEWGGDFKTLYDPAHWQLKRWKALPVPAYFDRKTRNPYSKSMKL